MTRESPPVLFTCRDAGAAHQIKEIIRAFRKNGFPVRAAASAPAYDILRSSGLRPLRFAADGKGIREVLACTKALLSGIRPSAVFCGLTTIGCGIDEAAIYWASKERMDIPSFQFLDSWGTFNNIEGSEPCLYFAIDRDAVRLGKGSKSRISVVGSPKHYAFSMKPISDIRKKKRAQLGIGEGEKLVGYFGQMPAVPGHMLNFKMLVNAFEEYRQGGGRCKLLARAHPAYAGDYGPYWKYLKSRGVPYINATKDSDVEGLISCCDVLATCYSTSASDHAYLSCYSGRPIGAVVFLIAGKGIRGYLKKNFGYVRNPMLERGIGYSVEDESCCGRMLAALLEDKALVEKYFRRSRSLRTADPCKKIVRSVSRILERRHGN